MMMSVAHPLFADATKRITDASILRLLGHPVRLKILMTLDMGECNVKNIWECLGMEQCVVSQHLAVLKKHDIITGRRRGAEIIYTIAHPLAQRIVAAIAAQNR